MTSMSIIFRIVKLGFEDLLCTFPQDNNENVSWIVLSFGANDFDFLLTVDISVISKNVL